MQPNEISEVRDRLDEFVQKVFGSLPRLDQRGKGGLYLQGLMLDERRKSMQPMGDHPRTVPYQQAPSSVKNLAGASEAFAEITRRHGTKASPTNPGAQMRSRFTAVRVRPANRSVPRASDGTLPAEWLIAEWPDSAAEPTE
ncbi:hypothetical protein E3T53_01175 [Cryobacterium psychrophilum]|uniref:Uncharacterized protein n=1 Tax=Cryobacterium psychrophilum TaxID=41988 RepID=A0A4Y8KQU6_9MICO|nr:hypothetical protein [Cryobacterium psychrophilum]TFD81649.1 hypothetical protein E3T53_01175 [Cryobacterium psychrophilum]